MGINPTPTNHRAFTFDGKSTREFGVYITGKDVFNSPERAVEMISIPGRDGEYALDQGHFNNIEVTYRAGIVSYDTEDFAEAISNFRNWLASRKGYCRLTDEYNPDEYRMAVFKNVITVDHEGLETGEFDVVFNCKPQRWLTEGETPITIGEWGETETYSGEIVSFEATDSDAVKALTADIDPIQDLNGYDAPWVGGAGKNKADLSAIEIGKAWNLNTNSARATMFFPIQPNTTYTVTVSGGTFDSVFWGEVVAKGDITNKRLYAPTSFPYTVTTTAESNVGLIQFNKTNVSSDDFTNVKVQVELGSTATSWTPYENICPISGHTGVDVVVSPTTDAEDGTTYTTQLGQTVYGGTLDVVSGVLTVDKVIIDLGTLNWDKYSVTQGTLYRSQTIGGANLQYDETDLSCSAYPIVEASQRVAYSLSVGSVGRIDIINSDYSDVASFKSSVNGVQLVYPLATPQTYQLTPQQIALLLGENNIFANSGDVTVEVGQNPSFVVNPTLFDSKPLLAVEGYGEIKFNGKSIVDIESGQLGDITIANNMSASSIQIDESLFNIGDTVTVSGAYQDILINLQTDGTYYNIVRESESITDSNTDFSTTFLSDSPGTGQQTSQIIYRITIPTFDITIGTDKTVQDVVSGTISCKAKNPSVNTFTATFTTTREYKYEASTNTITWDSYYSTVSTTAAYVVDAYLSTYRKMYFGSVIGHSTVSQLGNPTYIDCDIGEAYMIKDGQPISLNQYIDLGSDLPTLPTGATEITFDNTVTELKITPRWWKV